MTGNAERHDLVGAPDVLAEMIEDCCVLIDQPSQKIDSVTSRQLDAKVDKGSPAQN